MAKMNSAGGTSANSAMAGGKGMSPRKAIAGSGYEMGKDSGGNFGVADFAKSAINHGGTHPDATAGTGSKMLSDSERGIGAMVHHDKNSHPAQAAPDHGPMHPGGYMNHSRGR